MLNGLALNPALPEDLLLRLVRQHGRSAADGLAERPDLPETVATAMLEHPDPEVRCAAGANPSISLTARARLLDDPDAKVRHRMARRRDLPVPAGVLLHGIAEIRRFFGIGLMTVQEQRSEVMSEMFTDRRRMPLLARHPDPEVRLLAAAMASYLDEPERQALLDDESPRVREATRTELAERARPATVADLRRASPRGRLWVLREPLSAELVAEAVAHGSEEELVILAGNPTLPPDAVAELLTNPSAEVRIAVTRRLDLTAGQALQAAADPDPEVRATASAHPQLTESQRAEIEWEPDAVRRVDPPSWLPAPEDPAVQARSASPLLRRQAAADPRLPDDMATVLADDPDEGVRVQLARHHPAAPPELLLQVYLTHDDERRALLARPSFPRAGLARYADHPEAAVRLLAARDPDTAPDVVIRLLADPDREVRQSIARHPRLPVPHLVALLDDPGLSSAAAANPSLPVAEMERLIR